MTRYIYTKHARIRMKERRITESQVESVVQRPDKDYPDPDDPACTIAERYTNQGNTLRVVYAETSKGREVVTVVIVTVIRMKGKRTRAK